MRSPKAATPGLSDTLHLLLGPQRPQVKKPLPALRTPVTGNRQNPPRESSPGSGNFVPGDAVHGEEAASRALRPAGPFPARLAPSAAAGIKPVAAPVATVRPHAGE